VSGALSTALEKLGKPRYRLMINRQKALQIFE
jgi:hypothetical protein